MADLGFQLFVFVLYVFYLILQKIQNSDLCALSFLKSSRTFCFYLVLILVSVNFLSISPQSVVLKH